MNPTSIAYADFTCNPVRARTKDGKTGWACTKISPGCSHCYAETLNGRFGTGLKFVANAPVELYFNEKPMAEVPKRRKSATIFWGDMTDLFQDGVPFEWIDKIAAVCALTPQHRHLWLTKRPERLAEYLGQTGLVRRVCETADKIHQASCRLDGQEFSAVNTRRFNRHMNEWWDHIGRLCAWTSRGGCAAEKFEETEPGREYPSWVKWPLPNLWLGFTAEDQQRFGDRWKAMRPVAKAGWLVWCSAEPLLGPIDFTACGAPHPLLRYHCPACDASTRDRACPACGREGHQRSDALSWVATGGESGPKARPCDSIWIRSIVRDCQDAGVPIFVKQMGSKPFTPDLTHWRCGRTLCEDSSGYMLKLRDSAGSDPSEWPEDLRVRQLPEVNHA